MADSQTALETNLISDSILKWLQSRIDDESYQWITEKKERLKDGTEEWEFFSSFSAVPRYTGKDDLTLSTEEKKQAEHLRSGWKPDFWSVDQLGRALLVLSISDLGKTVFLDLLKKVFLTSDTGEAVSLYQSLAILPYPDDLQDRAAEGLRSNIKTIFNAVALRNPYPADFLDEAAWNQLVLKARFVGSPLYLIQGIDERANKKLAVMLVDYAHERWAAGRGVSPELWRPVGPYLTKDMINDVEKVLNHTDKLQQEAAILTLQGSSLNEAKKLLAERKGLLKEMKEKNISWDTIGKAYNQ